MSLRLNTISIVVPTYGRHDKLTRLFSYLDGVNVRVLVADGSASPYIEEFPRGIQYFHLPSIPYMERVTQVLDAVCTPHMVLLADDDFIDIGFLGRADAVLRSRQDCSTVFGRCYAFKEESAKSWLPIYDWAIDINTHDAKERLRAYFGCYFPLFYAPTRTHLVREAFRYLCKLPLRSACLIELMFSARLVASGKVAVLDDICAVREVSEVQRSASVYPELEILLSESPGLKNEMNLLLEQWLDTHDASLFSDCLYAPYYEHFIPWHARRFASANRVRSLWARLIGKELTNYRPATAFPDTLKLQHIQQIISSCDRNVG